MARVPLTTQTYTADGKTTLWGFPFPYASKHDVFVTANGTAVSFDWVQEDTIKIAPALPAGTRLVIYRNTDARSILYEFQLGAPFLPRYIDADNKQVLFSVQELTQQLGNFQQQLEGELEAEREEREAADIAEASARAAADGSIIAALQDQIASIQAQLSGGAPLEASAFSPISWHDKVIANSVDIPGSKNAWSIGPEMSILDGVRINVPEDTTWTVVEGNENSIVVGGGGNPNEDIDFGELENLQDQ